MPHACPVCGNEDYDEADGLFFCTECGTQSQELIVQEASVSTDINVRHEVRQSQRQGQEASEKPKADLGRPWTIYEAYQIIILAQAEALIAQGAKEELRDVVFNVWANYLRKLGVAFCRKEKLVPNIVMETRFGRLRELHRGTLDNPLNRRKRPFKKDHPWQDQADQLSGEEFYEEDRPADEMDDSIVFLNESDDSEDKAQSSDEDKNKNISKRHARHHRALHSPEWMNMRKTIALCYVGLMFTNPDILPCDVVRWVYEGKIPFLSATHLLPADMVLSAGDQALFEIGAFDTSVFISEINKLLIYLQLDKMPHPNLDNLICRFVKDLLLPGEVTTLSQHLSEKIPFLWTNPKMCYRRYDVLALSYIVLAMKLILHLDDSGEWLLSEYSQKLQDLLKPEKKFFIWGDWKKFMMWKLAKEFNAYKSLTSDISSSRLDCLDQLLKCYADTASDKKRLTTRFTLNQQLRPVRCNQPEFRASLRKPLEVALERLECEDSSVQDTGQSTGRLGAKESEAFQESTLSHITNTASLREKIGQLSSKKSKKLETLLKQFPVSRTEISQYKVVKEVESLASQRHESYQWLLRLVSEVADCSVLLVDKLVVRLSEYLIEASSGTDMTGLMCSTCGIMQTGERFAAKRLRRDKRSRRSLVP